MAGQLDLMNTQSGFTVKHVMVTTVRGQFKTFTADLDPDEQHPEASLVVMKIEAASIDTSVDYWDSHLRGEGFFDVERFPSDHLKVMGVHRQESMSAKEEQREYAIAATPGRKP